MGEEEKKPDEKLTEEKKPDEAKKPKEGKKEEKNEEPKAEKPVDDCKVEKKPEESKESLPPTPPPQEIVLNVYMHCEGCARKVRRCLKGVEGVEDVRTDCKTHKVVVKGEKADPLKVLERVQRKSHRQVQLLFPIPLPKPEEPKKVEEKQIAKPEEKKVELPVITVVLKVHMHCEACAHLIKKRIQRMKGVENAEPDLKGSQVTVKGAFEPQKLVEYVHKRTGKQAVIVKVEPEKKEEEKAKEGKEEEKKEGSEEKKAEGESKEKEGGGAVAVAVASGGEEPAKAEEVGNEESKMEVKKNEFYPYYSPNFQIYPQRYAQQDLYAYPYPYPPYPYPPHPYPPQIFSDENPNPPQIFSDENPNACSVM